MELSSFKCHDRLDSLALIQCLLITVKDFYQPSDYEAEPSYQAYVNWRSNNGKFSMQNYLDLLNFLMGLVDRLHGRESAGGSVAPPSSSIVGWAGLIGSK